MKLKLTLRREGAQTDVVVTADATASVGDVATTLFAADPAHQGAGEPGELTLHLAAHASAGHVLDAATPVVESGVRSGATVTVVRPSTQFRTAGEGRGPAAAVLRVLVGPDAGKEFGIPVGSTVLGRGRESDVRLSDPLVSKRHVRINVTTSLEVVDLGSANGVVIGGRHVSRQLVASGDVLAIGDTELAIVALQRSGEASPVGTEVAVVRSPRVVPKVGEIEVPAPEPPKQQRRQKFPWIALVAPLVMGLGIYLVSPSLQSVMFVALSPLLAVGAWADMNLTAKREKKAAIAQFDGAMEALRDQVTQLQAGELQARLMAFPSVAESVDAVLRGSPLLWTRRPEHEEFASLRLGLGSVPSAVVIKVPAKNETEAVHWAALLAAEAEFRELDDAPVVVELPEAGCLGLAGRPEVVDPVARGVIAQAIALHSPAELAVAAILPASNLAAWDWLMWLPHVTSSHSPVQGEHLAADSAAASSLLMRLEEVVAQRSDTSDSAGAVTVPRVLVLVDDAAPADRARLTRLAERGPAVGVHLVWVAGTVSRLPAACRTFVDLSHHEKASDAVVGEVIVGAVRSPVVCEGVSTEDANRLARVIAPALDAGVPVDDDSDLPRALSYLALAGPDLGSNYEEVISRWRETGTLDTSGSSRRAESTLRALVGHAGSGPLSLDLRTQGPHALVGGTTGAGKSEFLQSWILGMATAYSPKRVTFLFVDYKGGAAFADCVRLPHCVGLVTDLSPHLVRRALTSLRAELRHREHILNAAKAKDLISMEKEGHPDTPPALVIVVDEFAALVQEVPEFVDGMVDVAQRGRSLGLHLVLATQRPAGVIKDNLRANTNLRVALRMADEDDSTDILGVPIAAHVDPSLPGRGAVKTGPGRVTPFQTAYAGGRTTNEIPPPRIDVEEMGFGSPVTWQRPEQPRIEEDESAPTDIVRVVNTVIEAGISAELEPARRPWLDELASVYELSKLRQRTDAEIALGVMDVPRDQRQVTAYWNPDVDGNLGIYGTGGSGKSTVLRTIAAASAITPRGGPVHVYGLDFGSRGLAMLEQLPNVGAVISGDDGERVARLIRTLRATVDERAERYAAVAAGSVAEYRSLAGAPDEPRIVVLLDGMAAFREAYDTGGNAALFVMFEQIAADGRAVGIHVALTADRPSAVPPSIRSTLQRKLVLRLADEGDYGMLDVPSDVVSTKSPPGRGVLDELEIQVAVLGGSPNSSRQATKLAGLARSVQPRAGNAQVARPIQRLPEEVPLGSLPATWGTRCVIGVEDESLAAWGIEPEGLVLVAGPPGSGRTSALATFALAARRAVPGISLVHVGPDRSPLRQHLGAGASAPAARADAMLLELKDRVESGTAGRIALVIEDLPGALGTPSESVLEDLVPLLVEHGHFVVAEGELSRLSQYGPILQQFKAARRGIVLQPDSGDVDTVFRTDAPRSTRRSFPPGRGFFTEKGKVWRVQLAQG